MPGDRAIARLIYLYPIGLLLALGFAWAGRRNAFLLSFGLAVATTAVAFLYPRLADIGPHGSEAYAAAWRMAITAYLMLGGLFLAGMLSMVLSAWGAQRREARLGETERREVDRK